VRFVIVFTLLIGVFYAFYVPISQAEGYRSFLAVFARATSAVLGLLGHDVNVNGTVVASARFSMNIVPGCDGMEAIALFVAAVLASPLPLRARLAFMLPGVLGLLVVDLIRLVSLFVIGVHYPSAVETVHWDVWPGLLIAIVLVSWLIWARWMWRRQERSHHVHA
jgi:exosortase/archaeosortase family protein